MNINNRVEPDELTVINSGTTRLRRLFEHFRKRKLIWIICHIILIVVIIVVVTTTVLSNKTKREKTSAIEITTPTSASTTSSISSTTATTTKKVTTELSSTSSSSPTTATSDKNMKWKQNADTIAGGPEAGPASNKLRNPCGIYVDSDDLSIYIADTNNHRIVKWESDSNNGVVIAGGNGPGEGMNQLETPADVILDKEKKYLIICDRGNRRVMKWSLQNNQDQQIWIRDISCWSLAMDNNGDLYVSNAAKREVRRWKQGDSEGIVVAGGNGQGTALNQLNQPNYIFVDDDHSVYVADTFNNRVMKWKKNANEGILIASGQISNENHNTMVKPIGVIVDHMGNIYVSMTENNQITRWSPGATEGVPVVGEKESGTGSTQLKNPKDLSFDRHGNLYVVDTENHRIQKFDVDRD
ncbi:unnamed protein product [Adineta steineri]|uniref:Uncharacterized protein n=1 Tax=Adineta steineri TaxID=433720 RepID=A0A814WQ12_9BILA|nr:unnamed protein product [Adineta steineri]CAF4064504.1 unnamed protein product [Adineta steineri]